MKFNPVSSPIDGITVIEASAGTGKTFNMALIVLRFLLDGTTIDSVLAVTFTRAATSELKDRIRSFILSAMRLLQSEGNDEDSPLAALVADRAKKIDRNVLYNRLKRAYANIDTAAVFTIHGFCRRVIQEYAFETGIAHDVELTGDNQSLLVEAARSYTLRTLLAPKVPASFVSHISHALPPEKLVKYVFLWKADATISRVPPRDAFSWEVRDAADDEDVFDTTDERLYIFRFLRDISDRLLDLSDERGVLTYDSLISVIYATVQGDNSGVLLKKALRARFSVALIDEFQDTDALQYGIFTALFGEQGRPLVCIGDPKQAIYAFRGADVYTYLRAVQDGGVQYKYSLTTNWRSSNAMVQAVNTLFEYAKLKIAHPFLTKGISYHAVEASRAVEPLTIKGREVPALLFSFLSSSAVSKYMRNRGGTISTKGREIIAEQVATEIIALMRSDTKTAPDRPLRLSDIAVLVSSHRDAELFKRVLQQKMIPATLLHKESVFDTVTAREFLRLIAAVVNRSYGEIKSAVITTLIGGTLEESDDYLDRFYEWWSEWQNKGFLAAFSRIDRDTGMKQRIAAQKNGERILTNIRHLSELVHAKERDGMLSPFEVLRWFSEELSNPPTGDELQLRLESDANAVAIVTIHSAKGLQWPIVFLPTLFGSASFRGESGISHDESGQPIYHFKGPSEEWPRSVKQAISDEKLAEAIRLLYVGVTRAEKRCYILSGYFGSLSTSPLGYLLHGVKNFRDFKKLSEEDLKDDVLAVINRSSGTAAFVPHTTTVDLYAASEQKGVDKSARTFKGHIDRLWRVTSYSGLTAGESSSRDIDATGYIPDADTEDSDTQCEPIFLFPAGPRAGTALHEIFEQVDFTDFSEIEPVAQQVLERYSLTADIEDRTAVSVISEMVRNTLSASLSDRLSLSMIPREKTIREMEFFFPFNRISSTQLRDVLQENIGAFSFGDVKGFMHGFIDLVFEHEGKYYIVDWKSNLLGKNLSYYGNDSLREAIVQHNYRLQYVLYTVALHRMLSVTLDDYDYETHFGGVFYLFLRGTRAGTRNGVWYERPQLKLIERLNGVLGEGDDV